MYSERFLKSLKTRVVTTGYPAKAQWSPSSKPGSEPGPPGGAADRTERTRAVTERPGAPRLSNRQAKARFASTAAPARKTARALTQPSHPFPPPLSARPEAAREGGGRGDDGAEVRSANPSPAAAALEKPGPRVSTFCPYLGQGPRPGPASTWGWVPQSPANVRQLNHC